MAVKTLLARAVYTIQKPLDRLKFNLKMRLGRIGPITIIPYRGFGNNREVLLRGRVLENKMLAKPRKEDSIWRNLSTMIKRFTSEEVPCARVQVRYQGMETEVESDDEGYFQVRFQTPPRRPTPEVWREVDLALVDGTVARQPRVAVKGEVMVPGPRTRFGVISDVDDTILVSHVTTLLSRLQVFFLHNAYTRKPFEGVAAFYRALQEGGDGRSFNPIFYVSSSPWNIYDLFEEFCRVNGIPAGPFFLQDYGLERDRLFKASHLRHKMGSIRRIMDMYRGLPFILIGDSGQKDPEVYQQAVRDSPGRVLAIYIRDVTARRRHRELLQMTRRLRAGGVEMLLVKDTLEAARHAVARGYIHPDHLREIDIQKSVDERLPSPFKQMLGEKPRDRR